jgi:[ribosomal protein S5]-alanine N-acetyltransferase
MNAELGRFIVREISPWEAPRVFALTGDPQVTKYMGFPTHQDEAEAAALIARYKSNPQGRWLAVCPKEDPADLLGIVGFEVQRHQATLTIMFSRDWRARGAGRAFALPFVQWIFTHPQIWRVWAYCHVDNKPVQRVMERSGATLEGRLRRFEVFPNISTEPQDVHVYAIVREK